MEYKMDQKPEWTIGSFDRRLSGIENRTGDVLGQSYKDFKTFAAPSYFEPWGETTNEYCTGVILANVTES